MLTVNVNMASRKCVDTDYFNNMYPNSGYFAAKTPDLPHSVFFSVVLLGNYCVRMCDQGNPEKERRPLSENILDI